MMMGAWLVSAVLSLAWVQGGRVPVPDAAAQKDAQKLLREAFKADYLSRDL